MVEVELLTARASINVEVEGEQPVRCKLALAVFVILNSAIDSEQLPAVVELKVLLAVSGWLLTEIEKLRRVRCFRIFFFQNQVEGTHTRGIRIHDDFVKLGPNFPGWVVETMSPALGTILCAKASDKVHLAWNGHSDKIVELLNVGLFTVLLDDLVLIVEGLPVHTKY